LGTSYPAHYPDAAHPDALQPAQFAGCGRLGEPEWQHLTLGAEELLMLVSDGLHASLGAADWSAALARKIPVGTRVTLADLQSLLYLLIQTAQRLGSEDDITGLVVAREQGEEP
jgi:serine/threonine protein phosphatase PrpC